MLQVRLILDLRTNALAKPEAFLGALRLPSLMATLAAPSVRGVDEFQAPLKYSPHPKSFFLAILQRAASDFTLAHRSNLSTTINQQGLSTISFYQFSLRPSTQTKATERRIAVTTI